MILPRTRQTHAAVADHYDELDPIYRRLWGEHVHHGYWRNGDETPDEAVRALSSLVGEAIGVGPGMRLVDIGCGYGATARLFAQAGAEVTGFTLSAAQAAAASPASGVTIHRRDWLENGLPDAAFDGAYAIESSEHMADKPRCFAEARRVLRPGARLAVCAWLADPAARPWHVRHLLEPICYEGRLPSMGTPDEYGAMATRAGFVVEEYRDISREVARTWTICLGRLVKALATDPVTRGEVLAARNRLFAWSVPRLILAYRTGAMRYGVFTLRAV